MTGPSPTNPVATVQQILRRELRRTDLEELCDSELAELDDLLGAWGRAVRRLLRVRRRGAAGEPLDNPPGAARFAALITALEALHITDTIGAGRAQLDTAQVGLKRVERWVALEIEDLTHDPHREGGE